MKKSKASVDNTEENDDVLAKASQELEDSIAEDEEIETQQETEKDLGAAIVKSIKETAANFLGKAQTSTLSAEKDRRGSLTESKSDPAASPKKSGKGYEDSSVYEARKGEDMDDDDDDDDKSSKKKSKGKFGKNYMSKMKKMKKSHDDDEVDDSEDEESEDVFDATEMVAELGENVESISKSVDRLEEGMAVFGELLGEMSDPRRDKLLLNLAKAVTHIITEQKEIKKSLGGVNDLMKAVASMPGVPKVAGLQMVVNKGTDLSKSEEGEEGAELSKEDKDRLFRAAATKQISTAEMKKAMQTRDLSVLSKVK